MLLNSWPTPLSRFFATNTASCFEMTSSIIVCIKKKLNYVYVLDPFIKNHKNTNWSPTDLLPIDVIEQINWRFQYLITIKLFRNKCTGLKNKERWMSCWTNSFKGLGHFFLQIPWIWTWNPLKILIHIYVVWNMLITFYFVF